ISAAHVPATFYLYTDSTIRRRAIEHPYNMIIFPLVGIVAYPLFILYLWHLATPVSLMLMLGSILALIVWQAWHFGMQSYGAFSFVSITSGRPAPDPVQRKREKQCVIIGIVGGMLNVYAVISPYNFLKTMPKIDYAVFETVGAACHLLGS